MSLISDKQKNGLLIAIITGGRPELKQRPTQKLLKTLKPNGYKNIIWVVSENDAPHYEQDEHELCVYPTDWAYEYAKTHWMQPGQPEPNQFLGAFPGREWACLEAEKRGCWGVMQLDDNITQLSFMKAYAISTNLTKERGELAWFTDILSAIALSTNAQTIGASLEATPTATPVVARKGFPYSLFIEKVGEKREHWYGPFEDDITHSYQYGTRADGVTAALAPLLLYKKESKSKTGMRANYNHERSKQLQRIFPETAKVLIKRAKANGAGGPRIFHQMATNAIKNKLLVTDPVLYTAAASEIHQAVEIWVARWKTDLKRRATRTRSNPRKNTNPKTRERLENTDEKTPPTNN